MGVDAQALEVAAGKVKWINFKLRMKKRYTLIALLFFTFACEDYSKNTVDQPDVLPPDQESWNSEVILTTLGQPTAVIQYNHMTRYLNKKQTKFDGGIVVEFFNKEGEHSSHLTADRGVVYDTRRNFDAFGNVVLVSDSGSVLYTEELRWDNVREKIYSNVYSMFTTAEGDTLYGESFESDARMLHVRINQPRGVTHTQVDIEKLDSENETPDTTAIPDTTTVQAEQDTIPADTLKSDQTGDLE